MAKSVTLRHRNENSMPDNMVLRAHEYISGATSTLELLVSGKERRLCANADERLAEITETDVRVLRCASRRLAETIDAMVAKREDVLAQGGVR